MRTISEIVNASNANEPVTVDEARLVICCLDRLITMDRMAFMELYKAERDGKLSTTNAKSPEWQSSEHLRRTQGAYKKAPDQYLGWGNNPNNPEFLKRRKQSMAVMNKVQETLKEGKKNDPANKTC